MSRLGLWTIPVATVIALGASAPAVAGGGGIGGVCYQEPTSTSEGWVAVLDSCFAPQTISVTSGDVVRWEAQGGAPHTVTFTENIDSGTIQPGSSFAVKFNAPGSFTYACRFHPGMTGTVDVTGTALAAPTMELLDENGGVVAGFDSAPDTATAPAARRHRIEVDPIAAFVLLLVLFPLSMGAAMRLVAAPRRLLASPAPRVRWRLPWYVDRPPAEPPGGASSGRAAGRGR